MSDSRPATYDEFLRRFHNLKKMWFDRNLDGGETDYGDDIPPAVDRQSVARMFEAMGVQIPISPNDAPVFLKRRE